MLLLVLLVLLASCSHAHRDTRSESQQLYASSAAMVGNITETIMLSSLPPLQLNEASRNIAPVTNNYPPVYQRTVNFSISSSDTACSTSSCLDSIDKRSSFLSPSSTLLPSSWMGVFVPACALLGLFLVILSVHALQKYKSTS